MSEKISLDSSGFWQKTLILLIKNSSTNFTIS